MGVVSGPQPLYKFGRSQGFVLTLIYIEKSKPVSSTNASINRRVIGPGTGPFGRKLSTSRTGRA
ncbi:MAG: hypothetical protein KAJ09_08380, partial [Deltaproteobacteria bacterium]|nr:hypothetical protein [Deltaproteobacteria bacterium]